MRGVKPTNGRFKSSSISRACSSRSGAASSSSTFSSAPASPLSGTSSAASISGSGPVSSSRSSGFGGREHDRRYPGLVHEMGRHPRHHEERPQYQRPPRPLGGPPVAHLRHRLNYQVHPLHE